MREEWSSLKYISFAVYKPLKSLYTQHIIGYSLRFQVSVFRFQDLAIRHPDTRNLTPETYALRH